jgi:hypothetical protein
MGDLITYETFIARRGENEIERLKRKEKLDRVRSIQRLLGYADTLGDWSKDDTVDTE